MPEISCHIDCGSTAFRRIQYVAHLLHIVDEGSLTHVTSREISLGSVLATAPVFSMTYALPANLGRPNLKLVLTTAECGPDGTRIVCASDVRRGAADREAFVLRPRSRLRRGIDAAGSATPDNDATDAKARLLAAMREATRRAVEANAHETAPPMFGPIGDRLTGGARQQDAGLPDASIVMDPQTGQLTWRKSDDDAGTALRALGVLGPGQTVAPEDAQGPPAAGVPAGVSFEVDPAAGTVGIRIRQAPVRLAEDAGRHLPLHLALLQSRPNPED